MCRTTSPSTMRSNSRRTPSRVGAPARDLQLVGPVLQDDEAEHVAARRPSTSPQRSGSPVDGVRLLLLGEGIVADAGQEERPPGRRHQQHLVAAELDARHVAPPVDQGHVVSSAGAGRAPGTGSISITMSRCSCFSPIARLVLRPPDEGADQLLGARRLRPHRHGAAAAGRWRQRRDSGRTLIGRPSPAAARAARPCRRAVRRASDTTSVAWSSRQA